MATNYYLVINGVSGDYSDKLLKGAFKVSDFDFLTENSGTTQTGGGAGFGRSTFDPLNLTLDSNSYATLLADLSKGTKILDVSLIGENTDGATPQITYDLNLTNVQVTNLLQDTGGANLTLDYNKIGLVTSSIGTDGKATNPQSFGWDILENKSTSSGTELVSSGTVQPTAPVHYYLLIDGLNGGSVAKGHQGWFDLSSFNIDTSSTANIQNPNAGAGTTTFGDLSVDITGDLAALLADSAPGTHLKGVEIEGVSASGATVYDLEVGNVLINKVDDSSALGTTIDFNYNEIGLTTEGQNPTSGQVTPSGSFGWDIANNVAISPNSLPSLSVGTGASSAGGASSYYLVINGVSGDYSDKLLKGAFKVSDFEFLTENGGTTQTGGGGGGGVARSTFGPLTLTLDSNSYATLLADLSKGTKILDVSLIGENTDGSTPQITYDLNLANVQVTGLKDTSNAGVDLTLDYNKIGLVTSSIGTDGKVTGQQNFGWDILENKSTSSGTELVSSGTVQPTAPVHYYLLIDGLNGGSVAKGHQGWFDLSSFNIDTSSTANIQNPNAGAGTTTFGDLSVDITGDLAALLADTGAGTHLKGVEIEGVSASGATVYDLEVGNVLINKVDDTSASAATIDFNYSQIGLTTEGQNPTSGQVTPSGSFGWDIAKNAAISPSSLPSLSVGTGTFSAGEASSYYLVINGVSGDYSDKLLKGAFKVSDFEFLTENGGTTQTGGGGGVARSTFGPLTLTLDSNSYATLLADLSKGTKILDVSLIGENTDGSTTQITYDLNLTNVQVTDLLKDTDGTGVNLTLDYNKIGLVTSSIGTDGKVTGQQNFGWDILENKSTSSGTELVSSGTVQPTAPVHYYLLIDGLNGGSVVKGHQGWFDLSSFNIDISSTANIQNPNGGATKTTFGDLSVTTVGDTGLSKLLADSGLGTHLKGVEIEGVTAKGITVYDLEAANVLINKIDDTSTPGYQIDFTYSQIGLTTEGQNPTSGQVTPSGSFGWDVVNNAAISPDSLPTLQTAPCYCPGTFILTDHGEVPVETLAIGDIVMTMSGEARPIKWIGRRSYAGRFAFGQKDILPVCIKAGALDANTPRRDLWISPRHAMFLEGVLIEARDLVNGASIVQAETVDKVCYFHIELESHDVLVAEGSFSESFVDDDSRNMFHNAPEYRTLYAADEQGAVRYYAPRVDAGYAVEKARRHIEARAGLRPARNHDTVALRGYVDQVSPQGINGWAQNPDHPEAPVCLDIYAGGRLIGQTLANCYREDLQRAGLGSGRHSFEFTAPAGLTFAPDAVEVRRSFDGVALSRSDATRTNLAAVKRDRRIA